MKHLLLINMNPRAFEIVGRLSHLATFPQGLKTFEGFSIMKGGKKAHAAAAYTTAGQSLSSH